MKNIGYLLVCMLVMFILPGCDLVEGIFKAGMWWAFILIALVVIGIFWLLRRGK